MIKIDMEMPVKCGDCPCFDESYDCCNFSRYDLTLDNERNEKPDWCPLIEVAEESIMPWGKAGMKNKCDGCKHIVDDEKMGTIGYSCNVDFGKCFNGSAWEPNDEVAEQFKKAKLIEGCEFCRGEQALSGIYADIDIINSRLKISISDSIVDIDDWIKINYCPMCGKKLEESK